MSWGVRGAGQHPVDEELARWQATMFWECGHRVRDDMFEENNPTLSEWRREDVIARRAYQAVGTPNFADFIGGD